MSHQQGPHAGLSDEPGAFSSADKRGAGLAFLGLSGLTVLAWLAITIQYPLPTYYLEPHYFLGKEPGAFASPAVLTTTALLLLISAAYLAGFWILERLKTITWPVKTGILLAGLGGGLANVPAYPIHGIDVIVYLVQLRWTFVYGWNPYVTGPYPQMAQDAWAGLVEPYFLHPLIYGPNWLALGRVATLLSGLDDLLKALLAYKLFSLIFLAVVAGLLAMWQVEAKRRWQVLFLFLANPLVLFEVAGNGHNDIILAGFLVLAVMSLLRQSWLALPALTASALVKVVTLPLFPLFLWEMWRRYPARARIAASAVAAAGVALVLVGPFWHNGLMITGWLKALRVVNIIKTSSLVSIVTEALAGSDGLILAARAIFAALFLVVAILLIRSQRPVEQRIAFTLLASYFLVSNYFPWYLVPVFAVLCLRPSPADRGFILLASLIGLLLTPFDVWAWGNSGWSSLLIHIVQAILVLLPLAIYPLTARSAGSEMEVSPVIQAQRPVTRS